MKMVFVTLKAEVSDNKYSYHGSAGNGEAAISFEFPIENLDNADAGNLWKFLLTAAISRYHESFKKDADN